MNVAGLALAITLTGLPAVAGAHHLGTYTPRDNEISANFKQIKFSVEARKFDVALRLFEDGAVRREMREQAAKLPPGLEAATRAGLSAGDAPEVERALMVFLAALARNLALEAQQQMSAPGVGAGGADGGGTPLPGGHLALLQPDRLRRVSPRAQDLRRGAPGV